MLSGHPLKFSFVLANLGSNIKYGGTALNSSTPREPLQNPGSGVLVTNAQNPQS